MNISSPFIEETRFGNWFLKTHTWRISVLCRALNDLKRLTPMNSIPSNPRIVDIGCGFGHSFGELAQRYSPELILGVDADPGLFERASDAAKKSTCEVKLHADNAARMDLPDAEFDVVFCHQTFHHIVEQEAAMAEFFRMLDRIKETYDMAIIMAHHFRKASQDKDAKVSLLESIR
ncbi:MAG: methyltransferase domain-containing protein, partial [Pseudomonadota bacterium]